MCSIVSSILNQVVSLTIFELELVVYSGYQSFLRIYNFIYIPTGLKPPGFSVLFLKWVCSQSFNSLCSLELLLFRYTQNLLPDLLQSQMALFGEIFLNHPILNTNTHGLTLPPILYSFFSTERIYTIYYLSVFLFKEKYWPRWAPKHKNIEE